MKCLSQENTLGVSGANSIAAKSNTIEVNGDSFFYVWRHFNIFFSVVVLSLKNHHHLLQLHWIWLQRGFPLKLQKCFLDSNTPTTGSIGIVMGRQ